MLIELTLLTSYFLAKKKIIYDQELQHIHPTMTEFHPYEHVRYFSVVLSAGWYLVRSI